MHTASPQSGTQWANLVADHGVDRRAYGTPTVQVTGTPVSDTWLSMPAFENRLINLG